MYWSTSIFISDASLRMASMLHGSGAGVGVGVGRGVGVGVGVLMIIVFVLHDVIN